ncbi:MAG: M20 family metallo-hydrolase [Deltaproteobacteria bacterium]|jgi:succinyl-diaminopimelate desuccinylase|nr:M20 family metallo-hydrolase [Deltaproteobacteria bacterium]
MRDQLLAYLENQHDHVLELQRGMTAIPAIGPDNQGDGEAQKALFLRREIMKLGIAAGEIIQINANDDRVSSGLRPNLAVRWPGKTPRTLWVIGHMDVVPPGDLALWESPPFELRQDGDIIIGRGVEDNQQAIACGMLVLRALTQLKAEPDLSYGLLLVSDEETHSQYGLRHVIEAAPDLVKPDDLVLIPDIGDPFGKEIEIAEKSCIWLKVTITGKQCHASRPDEGINTLMASSAAVLALQELYTAFPQRDELFKPPHSTFAPSKKEANVENINTIPGLDVFYVDCRVLPGLDLEQIARKAETIVTEAVKRHGAGARVEAVYTEQAPAPTAMDSPVVRRLARSLAKLRGLEARPIGVGGQTVAAVLRAKGIPTAAWSTIIGNAHTPNEKSSLINTIADAKVVADMLFD